MDLRLHVFLALTASSKVAYQEWVMPSSKIALIVLITLFAATAGFAQDEQKEPAPPQNPASDGSQPNAPAPTSSPIRVGGNVASASLVHQVAPVYPPIAKVAHISGTVLLHALIAKDGTIEQLEVVSGPPLLLKSAMDAMRQWVYRPTLVNGEPVLVDTTISVVFSLDGKNPNNTEGSGSPSDLPAPPAELPPTPTVDSSQDAQKEVPTPQTPASAKPKRVRVGGGVAAAMLVHQVTPVYPKDAKKQHIQGAVLLHVTIAKDGTVENLVYVSGPPELTPSAMEAVKQWRYKPTLLNGDPVEVDTTISVNYTLGNH
jgi:TonB family protein